MSTESILEDIGLTKNEIKIYFALLEIGSTTTGSIIKKTGIHTSKVYDGLERLIDKGLVSYVIIADTKHFKAVNPNRIIDFLEEKKNIIDSQENEIKKILPELKLKQISSIEETEAEIFRGWKGMETVYKMLRDTLKKGDLNYVFGASKGEDEEQVRIFFIKHLKLLAKKGIKQKIIYNEDARGNIPENLRHQKLFRVRHLQNTTPAEINIWSNKVMIVLLTKKPIVILVSNKKVSESFKQYFNVMWAIADK